MRRNFFHQYPLVLLIPTQGFPQGQMRCHALRVRFDKFLDDRTKSADRGEIALVTLAFSTRFKFPDAFLSHSSECLQQHALSPRLPSLTFATDNCDCSSTVSAIPLRRVTLLHLCKWERDITTLDISPSFLKDCNVAQNALDGLCFILSAPPAKKPSIMATLYVSLNVVTLSGNLTKFVGKMNGFPLSCRTAALTKCFMTSLWRPTCLAGMWLKALVDGGIVTQGR